MRGGDKLLEEVDGTPLILRAVRAACAVSDEVIVALPAGDRVRRAWLGDLPARPVEVAERAMAASIRAGVAGCRSDALLVHLADMPEIGAAELETLAAAWTRGRATILRAASAEGVPGQPVVFDRALFGELAALEGDGGAKPVLARHGAETVALPGRAALIDLDTPEDWAAWREARKAGRNVI
ncbi:nucleotidyltransferase family protein [Jannaschia formosa]|nr:nucleotidyltransferase family protein [Jannaschia formosa]